MKKGLTKICYRFFTNLANPTRLATLEQLMDKPMSVNELVNCIGTRTKHDLAQPQIPSRMQPHHHPKTRKKTHLHNQPRNP